MRQPVSFLTQSRFYSPAFNAAIFDGPFRIYFSQVHEPLALKVFFHLQKNLGEPYHLAKTLYKLNQDHIFIMMYPSEETFGLSFPQATKDPVIHQERLGKDYVLGLHPDFNETQLNLLTPFVTEILSIQKADTPEQAFEPNV